MFLKNNNSFIRDNNKNNLWKIFKINSRYKRDKTWPLSWLNSSLLIIFKEENLALKE